MGLGTGEHYEIQKKEFNELVRVCWRSELTVDS